MRRPTIAGLVVASTSALVIGAVIVGLHAYGNKSVIFEPPPESAIPNDEFGAKIRLGKAIFTDTKTNAGDYVGNKLRCANCHLDAGRLADAGPLAQGYVAYPQFRKKNHKVNTFEDRLSDCFLYSMNGARPPRGSDILVALESYAFFLAKGAPTGISLPGKGYRQLLKPAGGWDYARGEKVFAAQCTKCHGADGQGTKEPVPVLGGGRIAPPPLWGPRSFNWGAGMGRINQAAGFIKANMPYGKGNTLTDQQAWDVAAFIDSHERPQDPRYEGSVASTRKASHDTPMSMYGQKVNGAVLGTRSWPSGIGSGDAHVAQGNYR